MRFAAHHGMKAIRDSRSWKVTKLLFAAMVSIFAIPSFASGNDIPWAPSFEEARGISQQSGRPVLVHFYSDHCPPCRTLEKRAFRDEGVLQAMGHLVIPVRVNVDQRSDLRDQFQIHSWPTDVYLFPNGTEIHRLVSPQDPTTYRQTVERVAMRNRDWVLEQNALFAANEKRAKLTPSRQSSAPVGSSLASEGVVPQGVSATLPNSDVNRQIQGSLASYPVDHPTGRNLQEDRTARTRTPSSIRPDPSQPMPPSQRASRISDGSEPSSEDGLADPIPSDLPRKNIVNRYRQIQERALVPNAMANPYVYESPDSQEPIASSPPSRSSQGDLPSSDATAFADPSHPSFESMQNNALSSLEGTTATLASQPASRNVLSSPPSLSNSDSIAFDGCCPVALASEKPAWIPGDSQFAVRHRGRVYYCVSEEARTQFMQDPDRYSPVFSGYDIVQFMKLGVIVEGKRQFGCWYNQRIYLFASRESYDEFLAIKERISADFEALQSSGRVAEGDIGNMHR